MTDITLLLAIHNHQPVGNFPQVFATGFERCYAPVLDAFWNEPSVRLSLHHTGPLLLWMLKNEPAYLERVREMARRGQLEVLGGGFYEPMLSVLPERDATGQILRMADFCEEHLGVRPRGMWLAERVWEPDLARVLHGAGVEYTLLDDTHFYNAGETDRYLNGSYVVEKAGAAIRALPISRDLRYVVPFTEVPDAIARIRTIADETHCANIALTYGDDGEKFGMWPNTWEWVFGKRRWLAEFLAAIADNSDWLGTSTIADRLDSEPAHGLIYLPTASYQEMGHWAYPPGVGASFDDFRHELGARLAPNEAFVRGGIWQGFLTKYPEGGALHKRVLRASRKLAEMETDTRTAEAPELDEARDHIYRAQCNCAYWHGLFGGIYLNWLRAALWHHLLSAEAILAELDLGPRYRVHTLEDVDLDGRDELVIETPQLCLTVAPHRGGALTSINLRAAAFNPTDVLARRIEDFHARLPQAIVVGDRSELPLGDDGKPKSIHDIILAKEPNLERLVIDDPAPRACSQEWIFEGEPRALADALCAGTAAPVYAPALAAWSPPEVTTDGPLCASLYADLAPQGRPPLRLSKVYTVADPETLHVDLTLANLSQHQTFCGRFASAWNLTLLAPDAPNRTLQFDDGAPMTPNSAPGVVDATAARLSDGWHAVALDLCSSPPAQFLHHAIETVSQSEEGFEKTYQGTSLLPSWQLELKPGATTSVRLTLRVTTLDVPKPT
jgi:4-alpha-glucanotransferase